MAQFLKSITGLMKKEWLKNKHTSPSLVIAGVAAVLFLAWEVFFGLSPAVVKVLDSRITFKFTALQDRDQYFVSYSLENTKKAKIKAIVRAQLGEESLGGATFHLIKAQTDNAVLEPLEIKSFVAQIDVPKASDHKQGKLVVRTKVKRISRA